MLCLTGAQAIPRPRIDRWLTRSQVIHSTKPRPFITLEREICWFPRVTEPLMAGTFLIRPLVARLRDHHFRAMMDIVALISGGWLLAFGLGHLW